MQGDGDSDSKWQFKWCSRRQSSRDIGNLLDSNSYCWAKQKSFDHTLALAHTQAAPYGSFSHHGWSSIHGCITVALLMVLSVVHVLRAARVLVCLWHHITLQMLDEDGCEGTYTRRKSTMREFIVPIQGSISKCRHNVRFSGAEDNGQQPQGDRVSF